MFGHRELRGARTIVTGTTSGIGRELVLQLADRGARVVAASRDRQRLDELAAEAKQHGGEVSVVPTDVADAGQRARLIETAVASLGGLDVLVNNAGVGAMGLFAEAGEERLRRIFEVNFFAATELTRLALAHLRQGKDPMIVNVASVIGRRAVPGCTEYCASKFAMVGWSEGLRAELVPLGIHVLVVCPGVIETEFRSRMLEDRVRYAWQSGRSMTAKRCAELIVQAMRRRQNELVTTAQGKFLVWLNRLFPRVVDWAFARYGQPVRQSE
jgi:short-subunit dehydrogenase